MDMVQNSWFHHFVKLTQLYLKLIRGGLMKIFLTILILILVALSLSIALDETAMKLHDEAFDRAMIAFGLAKGLNAIISLIQGTEVSLAPAGLGLNFSVGEVLDPFNDMVERFSWVMLFSSVSLGMQKLLLILSAKIFLQVALVMSAFSSLGFIWIKKFEGSNLLGLSFKIFTLFVLLRFGAIFFIYLSTLLYDTTLVNEYQNSTKIIADTRVKLEDINSKSEKIITSNSDIGFFETIRSKSSEIVDNLNLSTKLEALEENIEEASRNIINLITIFLLQSLVTPLLFLWFFINSVKWLFRVEIDVKKLVIIKSDR